MPHLASAFLAKAWTAPRASKKGNGLLVPFLLTNKVDWALPGQREGRGEKNRTLRPEGVKRLTVMLEHVRGVSASYEQVICQVPDTH